MAVEIVLALISGTANECGISTAGLSDSTANKVLSGMSGDANSIAIEIILAFRVGAANQAILAAFLSHRRTDIVLSGVGGNTDSMSIEVVLAFRSWAAEHAIAVGTSASLTNASTDKVGSSVSGNTNAITVFESVLAFGVRATSQILRTTTFLTNN